MANNEKNNELKISWIGIDGADCLSLCLIRCHIITEHLAYPCNICTASSQKCCCFKGSHTCTVHKVSRIDHNSRIQTIKPFLVLDLQYEEYLSLIMVFDIDLELNDLV